jgi:LysR family cys regulon transcriptional activator
VLLRKFMYEFLQLLAPHLNRRLVDRAHAARGPLEVEQLFGDIELPLR